MDPLTLSALVGGVQAVGNFVGGRRKEKKEREWASQDYERQIEDDRANWDRDRNASLQDRDYENQYNSPIEQRKRLEAAGLNPALIYGNASGATGTSASAETPSSQSAPRVKDSEAHSGEVGGDPTAFAQIALQAETQRMQKQMLESQQQLIAAQTLKTLSETKGQDNENVLFTETYNEMVKKIALGNMKTESDIDSLAQGRKESEQRIAESAARINKLVADTNFTINENYRKELMASLDRGKVTAETEKIMQEIVNLKLQELLIEANTGKTDADRDKARVQAEILQKELDNWDTSNAREWIKATKFW